MKVAIILILISCIHLGCASTKSTAPGMASLSVKVIAEPRAGVKMPTAGIVDVYTATDSSDSPFTPVNYRDLSGIVVWIEGSKAAPAEVITLQVKDSASDAQGVGVGGKIIIQNKTAKPQAVYSVSKGNEFDLGTLAPNQKSEYVVKSEGLLQVLADKSDDPIGTFCAVPSAWVKTMHSGDAVTFEDIPPGNYRVRCWHERLPGSQQQVTLSANRKSEVTLKVSVNLLPVK